MRILALASVCLLLSPVAAQYPTKTPFLWRIETPRPHYLYGTIHSGHSDVLVMPKTVHLAIEEVDWVYTETEKDAKAGAVAQKLLKLQKGKTLKDVLPEDVYERFVAFCKKVEAPRAAFERMPPWFVMTQLGVLADPSRISLGAQLDDVVVDLAAYHKTKAAALETPLEQIKVFSDLTEAEQLELFADALTSAEKVASQPRKKVDPDAPRKRSKMLDDYLAGDLAKVEARSKDAAARSPLVKKVFDRLGAKRNKKMTHRIIELLQTKPDQSFLFAVGVAHMAGEDGLLALLRARGYTITRLAGEHTAATNDARKKALAAHAAKLQKQLEQTREAIEKVGK